MFLKKLLKIGISRRGLLYLTLENYQQALTDFNKAISLNPNYAEAYIGRAAYYYHLGERKNAIADFDKATQLSCQQKHPIYQRAQETLRQLQTEN